jgi:hypothetical protein
MKRFGKHKLWIITLLLSAPVVVVAAVPNVFQTGTVISSAQVNANFAALDNRITALELAITRSGAQVVMDNVTGPLPRTATFQTNGNPALLIVSGTAYAAGNTLLSVNVHLDGEQIGELRGYTNEGSSHKTLPTRVFRATLAGGTHSLMLAGGSGIFDVNDFFSVTVVELPR